MDGGLYGYDVDRKRRHSGNNSCGEPWLQGKDGHMVAIPEGHLGLEGRDGRMVAIPQGYLGLQGRDGRMVAIPPARLA